MREKDKIQVDIDDLRWRISRHNDLLNNDELSSRDRQAASEVLSDLQRELEAAIARQAALDQ